MYRGYYIVDKSMYKNQEKNRYKMCYKIVGKIFYHRTTLGTTIYYVREENSFHLDYIKIYTYTSCCIMAYYVVLCSQDKQT